MSKKSKGKLKLLVCSKGKKCCKLGGKEILQAIEANLALSSYECEVKATKCLGMCKSGPSLVVMPGKIKHKEVTPKCVEKILKNPTEPLKKKKKK